jgi:hypothetical protein
VKRHFLLAPYDFTRLHKWQAFCQTFSDVPRRPKRDPFVVFLGVAVMSVLLVIAAALLLAANEWSPGDQRRIYSEHKAAQQVERMVQR